MLSVSLVAGMLVAIISIVFTLVNAPLYQQAASYAKHPNQMPLNVASSIFGLFVLTGVIGLIIYFIAGFITGRVAVARRLGFYGGFIVIAVYRLYLRQLLQMLGHLRPDQRIPKRGAEDQVVVVPLIAGDQTFLEGANRLRSHAQLNPVVAAASDIRRHKVAWTGLTGPRRDNASTSNPQNRRTDR